MKQLVSVIIPTYNRAHFLAETIQSVQKQTYTNWELIIVDDGSSDGTRALIENLDDPRLYYYEISHSGIIGKVRNKGLEFATGDLVAFLDSDDIWETNKLAVQVTLLNEHPRAGFTFSHAQQFGFGAVSAPMLEPYFCGDVFRAHLLEERFVLYPSTFVFKREALRQLRGFDESFSAGESDFFLRLALLCDGIFTGEKLVKLRKHSGNISREREMIFSRDNLRMLDKFVSEKYITDREYLTLAAKQHYKAGLLSVKRGWHADAVKCFLSHAQLKPFHSKGWLRLLQACLLNIRASLFKV